MDKLATIVLQRGGKLGAIGLLIAAFGQLVVASGVISPRWYPFFSSLGFFGLAIAVVAIAFHSKANTDILVSSEAEKRIQNPNLPPGSIVPQIQHAINNLQRETGGQASTT